MSIGNAMFDELLEAEARHRGEQVPGKEIDALDQDVPADESIVARQAELTKQEVE